MSLVRPFRGLRPKTEWASKVACPPYDVLNAAEARAMADGNPVSFLRVNKAELEFPDTANPYSDEVYQRAKQNLARLEAEQVMIRDTKRCYYLYRLTMNGRAQTGLVALTSVDEYDRKLIKKHEHTRPEKVNDRATHIISTNAQVGPVFTAFRNTTKITDLFAKAQERSAAIDFVAEDHIRHELWVIDDDRMISAIQEAFAELPHMYIADGHHRSEASSEVARRMRDQNPRHTGNEPYNFFLNVVFPDSELAILPYNRVVRDLNGLSLGEMLNRAATSFDVTPSGSPVEPNQPHQFGLYANNQWYKLTARLGSFDAHHPINSIDAAILSDNLLAPILGIANLRTDKRIEFVGGIRGVDELVRLVDSGQFAAAFALYPTSIQQLLAVADANEVMPPKSTWFEPKLRDGMVVNLLTE